MSTDGVLAEEMLRRINISANEMKYEYYGNKIRKAKDAGCHQA